MMKLTGKWNLVNAITKNLERVGKEAMQEGLSKAGLFAEAKAKSHISKQDLGWVPLNQKYRDSKERQGFSTNILVKSSAYFQAITSYTQGKNAYVGVKKIARDKDGNEIANIAAVHEFGSDKMNIPARPLWQPVLQETATWMGDNYMGKLVLKKLEKYK